MRTKALRLVLLVVVMLFAGAIAANVIHSPYLAISPGPTFDAASAITGPSLNPALSSQHFYITTVNSTPQTWFSHLVGAASDTPTLPAPPFRVSPADQAAASSALMISSQRTALFVAAPHPTLTPAGAQVILTAPTSPVPPDVVIVAVNATPVTSVATLKAVLARTPVGATLHIISHPLSSTKPTVITVAHYQGHGSLGIELTDWLTGTSPYTLSVPGVNGSSGGLMLALAITTATTSGSLAGPYIVSGTGTLAPNGRVGAIEGVAQKVASAASAGATLFFVAPANFHDAKAAAHTTDPHLLVIPAATYSAALAWLCHHGATSSACLHT